MSTPPCRKSASGSSSGPGEVDAVPRDTNIVACCRPRQGEGGLGRRRHLCGLRGLGETLSVRPGVFVSVVPPDVAGRPDVVVAHPTWWWFHPTAAAARRGVAARVRTGYQIASARSDLPPAASSATSASEWSVPQVSPGVRALSCFVSATLSWPEA